VELGLGERRLVGCCSEHAWQNRQSITRKGNSKNCPLNAIRSLALAMRASNIQTQKVAAGSARGKTRRIGRASAIPTQLRVPPRVAHPAPSVQINEGHENSAPGKQGARVGATPEDWRECESLRPNLGKDRTKCVCPRCPPVFRTQRCHHGRTDPRATAPRRPWERLTLGERECVQQSLRPEVRAARIVRLPPPNSATRLDLNLPGSTPTNVRPRAHTDYGDGHRMADSAPRLGRGRRGSGCVPRSSRVYIAYQPSSGCFRPQRLPPCSSGRGRRDCGTCGARGRTAARDCRGLRFRYDSTPRLR
jgi:hypothetical protein